MRPTDPRWRRPGRRGVSDVVATILLLALTVTLFASIFAFVTSFPSPPAQNNNQFQASLVFTSSGANISSVRITHLAGPAVAGTAQVYLKSATQPSATEFQSPYTVASQTLTWATVTGFNVWNLGQVWNLTFSTASGGKYLPSSNGNITIYVVAASQLVFSVILPGTSAIVPPTILSTWIAQPANPSQGQGFTVYASISGTYTKCPTNCVEVNLASVPGGTTLPNGGLVPMTQASQGWWYYTVPSGTTTSNGTFYAFVNASNAAGQATTGAVVIPISASSAGGPLSVGVVLVPAPPNSGVAESVQAVVTYTGAVTGAPLSVTFSGTSSPAGYTYAGSGPSSLTINGPSSVTVASLSTWTIPNPASFTLYTYTVSATATVTGVGTVTGTTSFTPATMTVGPASGLMGSTTTARGAGYAASSSVTLSFNGIAITPSGTSNATCTFSSATGVITTTATGTFACRFVVPNGAPAGATTVWASDALTGQNDSSPYSVTAWSVTLGPSSGLVGSTATGRGAGYAGSSSVALQIDGVTIIPSGTSNATCTFSSATGVITTTAAGAFTCRFTIPVGAGSGPGILYANDTTYPVQEATASFTVTSWTISPLSITSGVQATSVTVTATGFAASSSVTLAFDGLSVTVSTCTVGTAGSPITTSGAGAFTCVFTIPYGSPAGAGSLLATDSTSGQTASAAFSVTAWTLSVSPGSGAHGTATAVTITGVGFAVSSTVQLYYNGAIIIPSSCSSGTITGTNTIVTTAAGGLVCSYTVPTQASAGTYMFQAIDLTSGQTALFAFVRS